PFLRHLDGPAHEARPPPGEARRVVEDREVVDGDDEGHRARRDGDAGGVDDIDGTRRILDVGPADVVPPLVHQEPGHPQRGDRDRGHPRLGRELAVAGRDADQLDLAGRRDGGDLVDRRTGGATRHPVPALFESDGDAHDRESDTAVARRPYTRSPCHSRSSSPAAPASSAPKPSASSTRWARRSTGSTTTCGPTSSARGATSRGTSSGSRRRARTTRTTPSTSAIARPSRRSSPRCSPSWSSTPLPSRATTSPPPAPSTTST